MDALRARTATFRGGLSLRGDCSSLAQSCDEARFRYATVRELSQVREEPPLSRELSAMTATLDAALDAAREGATLELDELVLARDAGRELVQLAEWARAREKGALVTAAGALLERVVVEDALCQPLPYAFEEHPEEGLRLADAAHAPAARRSRARDARENVTKRPRAERRL